MESTIDTQEGTITAMKTQIKLLEEQIKSEETQNRLLKEELQQAMEDSKEKDNMINSKKDIITKLMQELEDEKRKNEEADLEMTAILSEKERIIMSFGDERTELNSRMKKLEFKCAELNEKLQITNIELADLKTEYTSYKVRFSFSSKLNCKGSLLLYSKEVFSFIHSIHHLLFVCFLNCPVFGADLEKLDLSVCFK